MADSFKKRASTPKGLDWRKLKTTCHLENFGLNIQQKILLSELMRHCSSKNGVAATEYILRKWTGLDHSRIKKNDDGTTTKIEGPIIKSLNVLEKKGLIAFIQKVNGIYKIMINPDVCESTYPYDKLKAYYWQYNKNVVDFTKMYCEEYTELKVSQIIYKDFVMDFFGEVEYQTEYVNKKTGIGDKEYVEYTDQILKKEKLNNQAEYEEWFEEKAKKNPANNTSDYSQEEDIPEELPFG